MAKKKHQGRKPGSGRPRTIDDAKLLGVKVPALLLAALDALATQRSLAEGRVVSRSDVIRDILQRAVEGG